MGKALADEFNLNFFETSAKLNTNVDKAFMSIATEIVERLKENPNHYGGGEGGLAVDRKNAGTSGGKSCC